MFYIYDRIISYNALLNMLHGERGVGKSYGAKKFVTQDFLNHENEFAYIRRYDNELKKALPKYPDFFSDITTNNEFPRS